MTVACKTLSYQFIFHFNAVVRYLGHVASANVFNDIAIIALHIGACTTNLLIETTRWRWPPSR